MSGLPSWFQRHHHIGWATADQVLVSGCNFLTGVMLARFLGPESFGVFVLIYSVLLYTFTIQVALIISPMLSTAPGFEAVERFLYLRSMLAIQLGLSLLLAGGITIVGLAFARWKNLLALENNLLPLAATIIAVQLQDWLRRYYFVEQKAHAVFINDVVSYGGQIVALIILFAMGVLDVGISLWVIAGTSMLGFALGWGKEHFTPAWKDAYQTLRRNWRVGRDYLLAWQLQWAGSQAVLLVAGSFLGAQAVGGIGAAEKIVGPVNIFYQGMENIVPIGAAKHFAKGGESQLVKYLNRITKIGTLILLPVLAVIALSSTTLMGVVYGEKYLAYSSLVVWQVFYYLLTFYLKQITYFYRATNQTRLIAWSSVLLAVTAIGVSLLTVHDFGQVGIIFSMIAGQAISLVFLLAMQKRANRRKLAMPPK